MTNSLSPWIYDDAEVLILGSFPSVKSLEKQMYYGNSRNQFWPIMENIYHCKIKDDEFSRKSFLNEHKIGLWDVLASCDREGSADNKITNEVPNDLENFVKQYPNLKKIIINGLSTTTGSLKYFNKYHKNKSWKDSFEIIAVPQTSPMPNKYDLVDKIEMWMKALEKSNKENCF
ncbi:MAG: DNA-deoxyinosine glycosylase [Alphaproteobacteria bacterium]|nr:DNA-deoxyinosine glycosylase [Alphaproteobacteria bacterium]